MVVLEGPQVRKITSTCTAKMDRCSHVFEIHGYSLYEGLGFGTPVSSATFVVGGYDWQISCYPDGYYRKDFEGYASIYLNLISKASQGTKVRGFATFRLVDPNTGQSNYRLGIRIEQTMQDNCSYGCCSGWFIKRSEMSPYLRDNCLAIQCDVSIIVGSTVSERPETMREIQVPLPPSDLSENLGKFLHTKEGADMTIKVKEEVFHAHKIVLAMRSPVFRALYGFVGKNNRRRITIEDMEPAVFKELLHFIYLPTMVLMERELNF
ncbi:unnamed protein product [Urochloa humidicola]